MRPPNHRGPGSGSWLQKLIGRWATHVKKKLLMSLDIIISNMVLNIERKYWAFKTTNRKTDGHVDKPLACSPPAQPIIWFLSRTNGKPIEHQNSYHVYVMCTPMRSVSIPHEKKSGLSDWSCIHKILWEYVHLEPPLMGALFHWAMTGCY